MSVLSTPRRGNSPLIERLLPNMINLRKLSILINDLMLNRLTLTSHLDSHSYSTIWNIYARVVSVHIDPSVIAMHIPSQVRSAFA